MESIQERLVKAVVNRGDLARVSRASGLSHTALMDIRDGRTRNPGINTVAAIERALDELERERAEGASSAAGAAAEGGGA